MASPMLQEIFGGALIGHPDVKFGALSQEQRVLVAAIAAGFTGLLSLFNIGGRFFWASLSDYIGRKNTYYTFFLLGIVLYATAPWFAQIGSKALFVLAFGVILSMYGGGFATVPAYLADIFGTQFVGAIHGRLLTAWSTAGIVGPVVVNYIREFEITAGVPRDHVYDVTMYVLAGMLVIGFFCNMMIKPLSDRWFMKPEEVAALQAKTAGAAIGEGDYGIGKGGLDGKALAFWCFVGIPIAGASGSRSRTRSSSSSRSAIAHGAPISAYLSPRAYAGRGWIAPAIGFSQIHISAEVCVSPSLLNLP
jgi:MFS family permease